jgi:hypothetical protein
VVVRAGNASGEEAVLLASLASRIYDHPPQQNALPFDGHSEVLRMEGFLDMLTLLAFAAIIFGIPTLLIVGIVKLWQWHRDYRSLVARVASLEARLPAPSE